MDKALDKLFALRASGTSVRTEVLAGLTTFFTMAYIVVVNPLTLAGPDAPTGMDFGAVMTATCLAAAAATAFMGLFANYPFALAPGMGLNAYFAYVLCGSLGLSWRVALGAVFIAGLAAVVVTATKVRQTIIRAIPNHLKAAIGAGIGLFIAFIGLKKAGLIVSHPATFVALGDLGEPGALLAIGGILLTAVLLVRRVPGGILLGIVAVALVGLVVPDGQGGTVTVYKPGAFGPVDLPPPLTPSLLQLDIPGALRWSLFAPIFSLFFVDLFDTVGTFVGVAKKSDLLDEHGALKRGSRALFADSVGTIIGSLLGTSNTTTYVESAAGVQAGGRTGLTAVVVAGCFLLAMFVSPLVASIPAVATAPALVIVGALMASSLGDISWDDLASAVPAFLTVTVTLLAFSIAAGLAFGFVAHVVLMLCTGRARQVHWFMWLLAALFVLYFVAQ